VEKATQNNLFNATQRLDAIIEAALDGIIAINETGIIEMLNPAAAKMFGYSAAELLGKNISTLMPQNYARHHDQYLKKYLDTGEKHIIGVGREVEGLRKDGSNFPLRLSVSEVKTDGHSLFTGIVHDLTEEKKAALALKQEKEKTQQYLDIANTMIVVINKNGIIELINNKGCELLGISEKAVIGRDWFDLTIPEEQREFIRSFFQNTIIGGQQVPDYFENEIITQHRTKRLIAWRNALVLDNNGEIAGTISSGVDITEQRAAEERIIRLNAELEQRVDQRTEELAGAVNQLLNINKKLEHEIQERRAAEAALRHNEQELRRAYEKEKELSELKSRFVSMASHEFRTPLSAILSSADLIDAYPKEDQQEKRLRHTNRIKSSVSNLTGILNDFLSLSKLEEGKVGVQPVHFLLHEFVEETLEEISGLLKSGQHIRKVMPQIQVEMFTDKKVLKNICFNLLSNAIKYSDAGQPIDCQLKSDGLVLYITVTDHGIGIPPEEHQHVFSRFFRAHNAENIQGTGLGLNIVKRYVELLNGSITFESELGQGTTFNCAVPIQNTP
jgi:two-component system sensor kinase FixL